MDRHDHAQRGVDVLQSLARQPEADVVHARPAVLLRNGDPKQPQARHATENAIAIEMMGAVVLAN